MHHTGSSEAKELSLDCRGDSSYTRGTMSSIMLDHFIWHTFWCSCWLLIFFSICYVIDIFFLTCWSNELCRGWWFLRMTWCLSGNLLCLIGIQSCYLDSGALLLVHKNLIKSMSKERRRDGYMNQIEERANQQIL